MIHWFIISFENIKIISVHVVVEQNNYVEENAGNKVKFETASITAVLESAQWKLHAENHVSTVDLYYWCWSPMTYAGKA